MIALCLQNKKVLTPTITILNMEPNEMLLDHGEVARPYSLPPTMS